MFRNHWLNQKQEREITRCWIEYAMQELNLTDPKLIRWLDQPEIQEMIKTIHDDLIHKLNKELPELP
tara:strand:- start:1694 stop:1894 length:201 start_codon:yes stop_codon:yes gene_type:complete